MDKENKSDKMAKMFDLLLNKIVNMKLNNKDKTEVLDILYKYQDGERADFNPKEFNQDILLENFDMLLEKGFDDPQTRVKVEQVGKKYYYELMEI